MHAAELVDWLGGTIEEVTVLSTFVRRVELPDKQSFRDAEFIEARSSG